MRQQFTSQVIEPLAEKLIEQGSDPGFRDGRFHTFRHYFVSQCFLNAIHEGTIRSWLGHGDSRFVEIYRHLAAADSKRLMDHLDFSGTAPDA